MKTQLIFAVTFCLLLGADDAKKSDKPDEKNILGTWTVVSVEEEGKKQDLPKNVKAVVTRDKITFTADGKTLNELAYKIDASKKPKWIDLTIRGKKQTGIFEIKGDVLRICGTDSDRVKRPTAFETKADSEHILMVFKRAKP
jgi:uncharacterized protein (TIGR03067 family)